MYRNWPKEHTAELCRYLKNYNVINLCDGETKYEHALNIKPESFRETAAVISCADLLVSVDTGPLHVAAALGIPAIAIFGPIDYRARCKGYINVTVMTADLPCIPCWRNSKIRCKQTDAVEGYSKCLSTVKATDVFKVVEKKIGTN
jgi:ADP-heptose:LPS heptosyltransferase